MIEDERADINTTAVGIVKGYDATTQTARVQPKLSMVIAGETLRAPELVSVPVMHQRAGGLIMHKPLKDGDEVVLHFGQRSLDGAIEDGSDQSGNRSGRMHSLSDAMAVPTAHSKGKQLPNLPADRMHFGSEDGKSGLQMKGDGSFDLVRNGDTFLTVMEDFLAAFRDHLHDGGAPHDKVAVATDLLTRVGKMKAT
ncbi:Gp138 family membrane-puncturing spike protein [Methylorubrum sp. SB2]|uniref:Gp138 family membrane-puncturing spike protein n=1 Tax=Methylorubrum subtropicum TaxID=3138812 RepID=UPI00313BBD7B